MARPAGAKNKPNRTPGQQERLEEVCSALGVDQREVDDLYPDRGDSFQIRAEFKAGEVEWFQEQATRVGLSERKLLRIIALGYKKAQTTGKTARKKTARTIAALERHMEGLMRKVMETEDRDREKALMSDIKALEKAIAELRGLVDGKP